MCQDSVNDLSDITISDKTEYLAELPKFAAGNQLFGGLKTSSQSDLTPVTVGSTEAFAGPARTAAVETTGICGLSNGQVMGEHTLWPDMAAMHLGGNDMMAFHNPSVSLYAPLVVFILVYSYLVGLNFTADCDDKCKLLRSCQVSSDKEWMFNVCI